MKNHKLIFQLATVFVALSMLFGCSKQIGEPQSDPATLSLKLSGVTMRAGELNPGDDAVITKVRIYVFAGDYLDAMKVYTAGTDEFKNPFSISTTTGERQIYVIANEADDMSTRLNGITRLSALKALITSPVTAPLQTPLMMTGHVTATVAATSPTQQIEVELTRLVSKVTLTILKGQQAVNNGADISIRSVKIVRIPSATTIWADVPPHNPSFYEYTIPVGDVELTTTGIEVWSATQPLYIYENQISDKNHKDLATYLEIEAVYNSVTTTYVAYINGDDIANDLPYNTKRNTHYNITATINDIGKFDGLTLHTQVIPWSKLHATWSFKWSFKIEPKLPIGQDHFEVTDAQNYVDFTFELSNPVGATWVAQLDDKVNFEFVTTGEFVDRGTESLSTVYKIRVKAKNPQSADARTTQFWIMVNDRYELPLLGEQEVGDGHRYKISQPALQP